MIDEDVRLGELVEKVRDHVHWKEAVCVRHWTTPSGPCFFEVGRWEDGSTQFTALTPLWSSREAAWNNAVERLKK